MKLFDIAALLLALSVTLLHGTIALHSEGFSDDAAYLRMRQVQSIQATGLPLINDPLAPEGKRLLVEPLYDYLLALVAFVLSITVALKVVPALIVGMVVLLVYALTKRITQQPLAALIAALATAAMPILLRTANTTDPAPLVLLLTLLVMLPLIGQNKSLALYASLIILFAFTHPSVALVLAGLLCYTALLVVENIKIERSWGEVLLFSTFFIIWSMIVRFRDAFASDGVAVFVQNVPSALRDAYFGGIDTIDVIMLVGLVPTLVGAYIIYQYIFRERRREVYVLLGFALAVGVLLRAGIVPPVLGLPFLGVVLAVLLGVWVERMLAFLPTTKFPHLRWPLAVGVVALIVLSSWLPLHAAIRDVARAAPSADEIAALGRMKDTLPADAIVLTQPDEAMLVEAALGVKVVQDTDWLTQHDAERRYEDVQRMYATRSKVEAVELLSRYGVTHIYVSPRTRERFGYEKPFYADKDCFPTAYEGAASLMISACRVV